MNVEFYDLNYVVKDPKIKGSKTRSILQNVNGQFLSGHLSAIMGPSGAGKTSLLNAVSGYKSTGVKGLLKINGRIRNESEFHKSSCYITQEDFLQPLLNVQEVMSIASNLKLPSSMCTDKKKELVDKLLSDLGLLEQKTTRTEYLSGGQKKRLSIALELINNPPVFFLDEPTTGLDTVSSFNCIKTLQKLSKEDRTIVCTIHQPSASLFQMFDHVYVLADGVCIYQGAPDKMVYFLSSAGLHCPVHYNPADYIIEINDGDNNELVSNLSEIMGNGKVNTYTKPQELTSKPTSVIVSSDVEKMKVQELLNDKLSLHCYNKTYSEYPTTNWKQFYIILRQKMKQMFRNKIGLQIQLMHHLMCGLAIGIMFYNNANDASQMFNHLKFCIGIILFFAYTQVMHPVLVYPIEIKLVKKEYFNRWYGITPYYAALTISKLPMQILFNMLFICLVYFMSGLPFEPYRFTIFCLVGNMVSLVAEGMGLAIGSIFSITNGCAVGPAFVAPFLGLAIYGFDFAKEISWLMYALMKLSFLRCGVVALVLTVFGYGRQELQCDDAYCHFQKPDVLIHYLNIENVSVWTEIMAMLILLLFFRAVFYLSLRRRFMA